MPVHAAAHLGGFFGGFGQRIKHGNGVDVLAGDGGLSSSISVYFGFVFFTESEC